MRLTVRPADSPPIGEWLRTQPKLEAEDRRRERPLDRAAALLNLARTARAAETGDASMAVTHLARITDERQIHGLDGKGREIFAEVQATSGRFTQEMGRDEPPHVSIARKLEALLAAVEADPIADRSPRAIIGQAVDNFGLQAVLAAAETDDFRQGVRANLPAPERPAKSLRTAHAAALRLLAAPVPAEAA